MYRDECVASNWGQYTPERLEREWKKLNPQEGIRFVYSHGN